MIWSVYFLFLAVATDGVYIIREEKVRMFELESLLRKHDRVQVYANMIVFSNSTFRAPGLNLHIIATKWRVRGGGMATIDLSGTEGAPGSSGGNFSFTAGSMLGRFHVLSHGGRGQNGRDGKDGADGENVHWLPVDFMTQEGSSCMFSSQWEAEEFIEYYVMSPLACGQDGGDGGQGWPGGPPGQGTFEGSNFYFSGERGRGGWGGRAGRGGRGAPRAWAHVIRVNRKSGEVMSNAVRYIAGVPDGSDGDAGAAAVE